MARDIANGIYWDESWSPIIGCNLNCVECWAAKFAHRFAANNPLFEGLTETPGRWNGRWRLNTKHLADPLRWTRPRYIGCNWMGDLFHPDVPDSVILLILSIMSSAMEHTFFLLTKHPERLARLSQRLRWVSGIDAIEIDGRCHLIINHGWLDGGIRPGGFDLELRGLPGNVWAGTSVSNNSDAIRLAHLSDVEAIHKWVSMEPLIVPLSVGVNFSMPIGDWFMPIGDWLVIGGHNAPNPMPIPLDYVRWLRDIARNRGVPFFFKQMHGRTKAARQNIPADLLIRQMPDTTRRRKDGLKAIV